MTKKEMLQEISESYKFVSLFYNELTYLDNNGEYVIFVADNDFCNELPDNTNVSVHRLGVTPEQLRNSVNFAYAYLSDSNVNVDVASGLADKDSYIRNFLPFINGETDVLPLSPCGIEMFLEDYNV